MKSKSPKDRHLDTPADANRDKHINFTALENNDVDPADNNKKGKLAKKEQQKKENEKNSKTGN